jgi:signal transduction histidine kinase
MPHKPFNLSRRFALLGLLSISFLSVAIALLLSRFLTERMMRQEAVLTMEFIHSVVLVENAATYFLNGRAGAPEVNSAFNHVANMPDVIRASAHSLERRVIWSSDKAILGRQYLDNPELELALAGDLVVHGDSSDSHAPGEKSEHASLNRDVGYFVEIYFPVRDAAGQVVGAVELYKKPRALYEAINAGRRAVWLGAVLAGLFLYGTLFWLARRADNLIKTQQRQLVESETLAAIGEMGSAVAHGIRNPLASIRSSAELALETAAPESAESARDIIAEVDRMDNWVRELLTYARPMVIQANPVDVGELVARSLADFERETARRGIVTEARVAKGLPPVQADSLLLGQVLGSVMANAVEALGSGGHMTLSADYADKQVLLRVADDGPGIAAEQLTRIFKPFFTTKPKGLGVGLPLAKRIVERFGGGIRVQSEPGRGTTVELQLPVVTKA